MSKNIQQMSTDQVRAFMDSTMPDRYTLLDVRQDWEYEEFHIPGAQLIPLPMLADRLDEVDKNKPVVVYCASGGRSMAASSLMAGNGFADVTNMVGGAMAWQGHTAFGPMELGLIELVGNEAPVEIILKAYAMEHALQKFYLEQANLAETKEQVELFTELAGFEDKHKRTLYIIYKKIVDDLVPSAAFEEVALEQGTTSVEGGVSIEDFLNEFKDAFDSSFGILQFASMVEAQALDYYFRCSREAHTMETADIFTLLAREEKAHLRLLGKHMDRLSHRPDSAVE